MGVTILGIESSCDETSAAVLHERTVLSNIIANQKVHEKYGGVVPELASRAHQSNIVPVIDQALAEAGTTLEEIDAIAYTIGPGLLGSLMVGSSFAKGLSIALNKPLIEVNHMKAHVMAHFIDHPEQQMPALPFICLTVSGGHTQLVLVNSPNEMEVIGQTLDDAAGEAFDKAAKIMGLPYPGGPLIDKYAKDGLPDRFEFSKPQVGELEFSFSGLKTSFLYFLREKTQSNPNFIENNLNDLCASIQKTIVDILIEKLMGAAEKYGVKTLAIAGGVSANSALRQAVTDLKHHGYAAHIPVFSYCTDNAAMIAMAGYYSYLAGEFGELDSTPMARMQF
ncbi:MAG: tRNA (adenosine(37)-N6)-threonylcarbamoyltransferase complex transferase subunit TsaD [Salibacteraceae bacterium]